MALINSENKVNTINLTYNVKLDLQVKKTNINI